MEDVLTIQTKLGQLRGRIKQSKFSNNKYYAFIGIPYGKPPVGQHRFKAPRPFGGWEGVRDALEDGNEAKQPLYLVIPGNSEKATQGSEDCLYLCVYINEVPEENQPKKPVMFYIHGGAFNGGSANFKGTKPDYLMEADIVLVTINYRCGAFGFLSLENEEVPGNAGLKDQALALRWVQDNIDSFGGDPNNVTIFGFSAGGCSVNYHMLSPQSQGLFHKAIMQSGTAFCPWALQPSPRKMAIQLAKKLGCESEEPHAVLEFLQSASSDSIVTTTIQMSKDMEHMMSCSLVFSPCVEIAGKDRFLSDHPKNLVKGGNFSKVPTIQGHCQMEGWLRLLHVVVAGKSLEESLAEINNNHSLIVPSFFGLESGSTEEKQLETLIWDFYFKGEPLSMENIKNYMEYQSDVLMNIPVDEARRYFLQKSSAPAYTYLFTNHTGCFCTMLIPLINSNSSLLAKVLSDAGTCHSRDSHFLLTLTSAMPSPTLTAEVKQFISKFVKAWTQFARTGNPNGEGCEVEWERDSESNPCYMDIGTQWAMREGYPFPERSAFWQQLIETYCKT